jgi:asparagine synthase (glutamine-hydrolysing)
MCGITGIYAFNEAGRFHLINLQRAVDVLEHRGPDTQGTFIHDRTGLGHRRLSVIDTSPRGNQPMKDSTGRYTLVFNGEIYNYQELRKILEERHQVQFRSQSDTEVLLHAYIIYGEKCLQMLNGFFTFGIYDRSENELFIARDRFGIKPVYYYQDEDKFLFASELRSILAYGIQKSIKTDSLVMYLQLNYIPAPLSILNGVSKLLPGHSIRIRNKEISISKYYELEKEIIEPSTQNHSSIKEILLEKLEDSIKKRLVSDVPLGVFLSGGIDSSIITALASRHQENLRTFSIGYKNSKFFDEKKYALQVAKHFKTDHRVFDITNQDLLDHLPEILDHFDEPFADSSAIPVYLLSKLTKENVTVALSGDGADEIFSGYNKHMAFQKAKNRGFSNHLIKILQPFWKALPKSRNNFISNRFRQLDRYARGLKLTPDERYWLWASFLNEQEALSYFTTGFLKDYNGQKINEFKHLLTSPLKYDSSINKILMSDTRLVLPNDMLYKVDLMSMANGLEVRVPFLDHNLVEFAMTIPEKYKINSLEQKIILREVLKDLLPGKLHQRPKHGFEVPLLNWFRKDLKPLIKEDLLADHFIKEQGIFDIHSIGKLKKRLYSPNPGDAHANIWALIVFQSWWKKYLR